MRKLLFILIAIINLLGNTIYNNDYKEFEPIIKKNITGSIETIGNTVECVTRLKYVNSINEINLALCENNYSKYWNNKYISKFINVIDNNSSIFNSSTATLKFPSSYKKIIWAALFWQGHINNYTYQYSRLSSLIDNDGYDKHYNNQTDNHKTIEEYIDSNGNAYYHLSNDLPDNDPDKITETNANKIILIINNQYYSLTAKEVDYKSDSRDFKNEQTGEYERKKGVKYSAYVVLPQNLIDKLNSLIDSNSNREVNVTVANITTTFGLDERLGDYGAWSLAVIYEEASEIKNYKSNIVYYGFKNIYKGDEHNKINIPITGLILPKYGNVNSKLSIFSAEGEYVNKGDDTYPESVRINEEFLEENLDNYDKFNVFDGRLSSDIEREPTLQNNDGIDIDVFDASDQLTKIRDTEKEDNPNRVTYDVNITVSTYNDGVFLSSIAFSTQLYVPKVCYYDFNLYDKDGNKITSGSQISAGETIKVKYKIKNDENESAVNVHVFYPFENNITKYISNSTNIKNVLSEDFIHIEDNQSIGNLGVEVNESGLYIGILGDSNNEFKPYSSDKNYIAGIEFNVSLEQEGNLTFNFYTDYNYTVGGENFRYDGMLPNCREFNNTYSVYQPKIAGFNVVHYQPDITYDPIDVNDSINALYTQIVNKEFNVTVVKLADDNETLESYLGFVKLDLINAPQNEEECKTLPSVIPYRYIMFLNQSKVHVHNIIVPNAYRDLRFRITYVKNDSDSCMNALMNFIENPFSNWANAFSNCASCGSTCVQSMMGCTDIDNCQEGVNTCLDCIFGHSEVDTVCSRDDFAIRPYAFLVFGNNQYKRAGEDFNVTIKAVDENNYNLVTGILSDISGVGGYDVNLSDLNISAIFYSPTADEVKQMNQDVYGINDANASRVAYCPDVGIFNIVGNNIHFINGEVNATLNYSESGILSLKVSEINGSEFAKVDEKDTPDSQRLIKAATTIINKNDISQRDLLLEFIPYKFVTEGEYNTTTNGFVYMDEINNSFTPDMAAFLRYKIIAKNKNDEPLKNFTKTCFPDTSVSAPSRNGLKLNTTFDLFLDADVNISDNTNLSFSNIDLKDNTHIWLLHPKYNLTKGFHHIQEWISPLNFVEGEGEVKLFFNIDKDFRHPRGEVNITVNDINTSTSWMSNPGATKIFEGTDLNNTAIFRYGRIRVENISGYGNEINTTFKYQYWDNDKGWVVNKDHISSVFGDINNSSSYLQFVLNNFKVNMNVNSPIQNGEKNVTFTTSHALPYSAKIHLSIPSWLWYHPLAQKYKNPSATNLNCLTHPCFKVNFKKESSGWGGIGTQSQKYKETNRTSEINASLKKINVNKKTVKKINW